MTSYYVPSLTPMWGDNITALWSAEFIRKHRPDADIVLDDSFCETGKRPVGHNHSMWVKIPWASVRSHAMGSAGKSFDRIVSTHHRHNLIINGGLAYATVPTHKLTYIDAHGIFFRMVTDNVYPTFLPTEMLLDRVSALKLPEQYVAIHVNDVLNDPTRRNLQPARSYFESNASMLRVLASNARIVTTGAPIDKSIVDSTHISNVPGWVKLAVLIGAQKNIVSMSGFTAISAAYRKRRDCTVVNHPVIPSFNMGPPNLCYSNYHIVDSGSLDELFYSIDTDQVKNVKGAEYWNARCCVPHWCSFETFDIEKFDVKIPSVWQRLPFYDHIENCPVPLDAKYKIDGIDKLFDMRHDADMVSIPMNRPRKR
jgi:hypothetical protein